MRRLCIALAAAAFAVVAAQSCDNTDPFDPVDGDADTDIDSDSDTDTDADTDADGDSGGDADADGDPDGDPPEDGGPDVDGDVDPMARCRVEAGSCSSNADCMLALNFRVCCPCLMAWPCGSILRDYCFVLAGEGTEAPAGCDLHCGDVECAPCPEATGGRCVEGACVTAFTGECVLDEDCADGELCELVEGSATCVDDPNECYEDGDCPAGHLCRDWLGEGILFCRHSDSACASDGECDYNHFCEDPDGDTIFECVDRSPLCRVGHDSQDCPSGESCVDDDGDGRGECR